MTNESRGFYDEWASHQLELKDRASILNWKAANLANLYLRTFPTLPVTSIAEVGGAEGRVLAQTGMLLGANELVNYEISSMFCEFGKSQFPRVEFVNSEFPALDARSFDVIVLSDILEHVESEDALLDSVASRCSYLLCKIPIEECVIQNDTLRMIAGKRKAPEEQYGPDHRNGHLRGYTVRSAKSSVSKYFEVIDSQISDTLYFYGKPKHSSLRTVFGTDLLIRVFGGALFLLASSPHATETRPISS